MNKSDSTSESRGALASTFRSLRHRNYRLFFGGQGISLIGTWMTRVATSWLVYETTGKDWLLGIVSFAGQAPILLLAPVVGVLVERIDRLRVLVYTQVFAMFQSLALAALALGHWIEIWQIIVLAVFQGVINAIDTPARQAFLVEIVDDRRDLSNAIALNSSMFNGARLVGPAIAGVLYAQVGAGICFLIDGLSYLAVIAALLAMRVKPRHVEFREVQIWHDLKEGIAYVYRLTALRALFLLLGLVSIVGVPYMTLMPVFAKHFSEGRGLSPFLESAAQIENAKKGTVPLAEDVTSTGADTTSITKPSKPETPQLSSAGARIYGFLLAASGSGALCGALFLATRNSVIGLGRVIAFNSTTFGLSVIGFAFSPWLWLSMLLSFTAGFGLMAHLAASNTIVQTVVDDDKRARVMGFYTTTVLGMTPLGSLLASGLVVLFGAAYTVAIGGVLSLAGALYFIWWLPVLRAAARPMLEKAGVLPPLVTGIQSATQATEVTPLT